MASFAPEPPNDLVLPERGSTTARAVSSLSLRKLFDWLKTADRPDADPGFTELRALVSSFLPGRPKTVAALVDAPTVSAPLRLLRAGVGDAALLGRAAADAARDQLEGRPALGEHRGARFLARTAVVTSSGAPFFLEWPELRDLDLEAFTEDLRRGHALLRDGLPGVADALERVARAVVPIEAPSGVGRCEAHAPSVIGVAREPSAEALALALGRATPVALLFALRELDPIGDAEAFEQLCAAASAAVAVRLAEVLVAVRSAAIDVGPLRGAFAAAFRALAPHESELTPVGRGIYRELERRAGYDRGGAANGERDE